MPNSGARRLVLCAAAALGLAARGGAISPPLETRAPAPTPTPQQAAQNWEQMIRDMQASLKSLQEAQASVREMLTGMGLTEEQAAQLLPGAALSGPNFAVLPEKSGEILMLRPDPDILARIALRDAHHDEKHRIKYRILTGNADKSKNKIVVLDFWAGWCKPCQAARPYLNKIAAEFGPRGVEVVGIATQTEPEEFAPFVAGCDYTTAYDNAAAPAAAAFSVKNLPTLLVIDKNGSTVYRDEGFSPSLGDELRKVLTPLLAKP